MEFNLRTAAPVRTRSGCVVVAVLDGRRLSKSARAIDEACGGALAKAIAQGDLGKEPGSTLMLRALDGVRAQRVLAVRAGSEKELSAARFRRLCAGASTAVHRSGAKDALMCLGEIEVAGHDAHWKTRTLVDAVGDAIYRYSHTKSKAPPAPTWARTEFAVSGKAERTQCERAVLEGSAIVAGKALAKDLGNLPGNVCTPTYLADQARKLAKGRRKLRTTVLDEAQMRDLGMGSLLSVAAGSRQKAKLIVMEYKGGRADRRPVVLVGKGVTFDTGGISLKPGSAMDEMKFDMCGAASVFGAIQAAADMGLALNVVGLVPATENMPDGNATKPGDVVTSMSGRTIEILNTDAEGRLILCDALTYAERFDPDVVIDIATLTGACVVALGRHPSGLFSNHDKLRDDLCQCGDLTGDRVWPMPVWDEYQRQLDSNFADVANIGGRDGGAITAACFLARFTEDYRWAHLDIAGTAWHSGAKKGSSGRPVPLLTQYLIDHARPGAQRKVRA